MTHIDPPAAGLSPWRRLLTLEPAVVRVVVGAIVAALLVWGVDLTDLGERIAATADILGGTLVPALTAWWVRSGVTPTAKVVQEVTADGLVIAGPASPLPTGARVLTPPEHDADLSPYPYRSEDD